MGGDAEDADQVRKIQAKKQWQPDPLEAKAGL